MSTRRFLMLSVVLVAAMVCAGGRAQTIPKSHGTTLAGTAVVLPDALKGKVGVLVVGFSHASQRQIATWTRLLEADYGKSNDVTYFALPMLPKMLRGMIEKSMTRSVPFTERQHYLPITEGEPAWRGAAHYDKPDEAYVLLVDRAGTVRWQTEGEATDLAYTEMKRNLRPLTARGSVR
jgi:ATP10 protein